VSEYPGSKFAPDAARALGVTLAPRSVDPAEAAYGTAERLLLAGKAQGALDSLRSLISGHPSSHVASKAHYAVGWIYESIEKKPDSAAASYRRLVSLFPGSPYAAMVKPRLDEYDAARARTAVSDSAKPAGQPAPDSLKFLHPKETPGPPDSTGGAADPIRKDGGGDVP
jgi:TolA-binding protein